MRMRFDLKVTGLIFAAIAVLSGRCEAAKIIDVRDYDVVPNSGFDSWPGISAAIRAAQVHLAENTNDRVEIRMPAGRYMLRDGIKVPSKVSIVGAIDGETVINFSPPPQAWGRTAFSTQNAIVTPYIAIARADDPSHPPVQGSSYKGLNFVYLHDLDDVRVLRQLGVPSKPTAGAVGFEVAMSAGATLVNNTEGKVPASAPPAAQLIGEPGANPAPAVLNRIIAVDDKGLVLLEQRNRFDWGREFREPREKLEEYYNPHTFAVRPDGVRVSRSECPECRLLSKTGPLAGPGWIVPMNQYTHDVRFENLIFEQDRNRSLMSLQENYLLYLMYVNRAVIKNCKFRNTTSYYPVASVRGFNIDIDNSEFSLSAHAAVTLDSGSNYTIRNSRFRGDSGADAARLGILSGPKHFIIFDEAPIDITIVNNTFENLKSGKGNDGIAIFGVGGAFSRILDNTFKSVERAIFLNVFMNDHSVVSGNSVDTRALLYSGSGTAMAAVSNNSYLNQANETAPIQTEEPNFDSYNKTETPNYVCANRGVVPRQWYRGTTRFPGNVDRSGRPVVSSSIVQPNEGWPKQITASHGLNRERLESVSISGSSPSEREAERSVIVTLSQRAESDFPFTFEIAEGDVTAALSIGGTYIVPAGAQTIEVPRAMIAQHEGEFILTARSLCKAAIDRVSTSVRIGP